MYLQNAECKHSVKHPTHDSQDSERRCVCCGGNRIKSKAGTQTRAQRHGRGHAGTPTEQGSLSTDQEANKIHHLGHITEPLPMCSYGVALPAYHDALSI